MNLELREITGTPHVPATFRLRYDVWNAELLLRAEVNEAGLITDEHDAHARHWAVFNDGEIVAAARMCIHKNLVDTPDAPAFSGMMLHSPVATLNRLVVHRSARHFGAASLLDDQRISAARADGANCIVGTFPTSRVPALKKRGFCLNGQIWTPTYADAFISYAMVLDFL